SVLFFTGKGNRMSRWEAQSPFASERDFLPSARTEGLESSYADGEVLLYDTRSHHIHHLDQECTVVWHHCDGRQTSDAISIATGMHPERVKVALRALSDCNLLVDRLPET